METVCTVQMHCKLNQFIVTCLRVPGLAWSVRRALHHHMPSPRVSSCLLLHSSTTVRTLQIRQFLDLSPEISPLSNTMSSLYASSLGSPHVAQGRASFVALKSNTPSARRLPHSFPILVFLASARNVYRRPLFQAWFTRNMQLPSLFQDLAECCSWIHCGRSLSGTRTAKSSWETRVSELNPKHTSGLVCAQSSNLLFKSRSLSMD